MKRILLLGTIMAMTTGGAMAADLSPAHWPAEARTQAEQTEAQRWTPEKAQVLTGKDGAISATVSPIAVEAGLQALRHGGNAADAAATVAVTQITTQLGSVVSYAGIMTMLYYDAKTGKVTSLDAGYNSYKHETDPRSIPAADLGPLRISGVPAAAGADRGDKGRETLVPGFMAGIEALHERFGKLPFRDLFAPALYYAENGVTISPPLAGFFKMRESVLEKSPEGIHFMHQAGDDLPKLGDKFVQPELARTLRGVAEHGARYMYTGPWGKAFVEAVQKAGGKVTPEDLADYRVLWSEPYRDDVFGHTVYVSGEPSRAAYQVLTGLNIAEALKLDQRGPYWSDPVTFRDLSRIGELLAAAPDFSATVMAALKAKGIDTSPEAQRSKAFAAAIAPMLGDLFAAQPGNDPHHSNSIVVVDREGNIAVMTHTINAVIWGSTGIVVGGIPLPDSAGFQQARLATLRPGDRVPHEIACTLTFAGAHPVLATAPIGSSLVPETIKTIFEVIGQKQDLATAVAAPPLLVNFGNMGTPLASRPVSVPAGSYDAKFLEQIKALGVPVVDVPVATAHALRGTLSTMALDPATGAASTPDVPDVMVFGGSLEAAH